VKADKALDEIEEPPASVNALAANVIDVPVNTAPPAKVTAEAGAYMTPVTCTVLCPLKFIALVSVTSW
jgi:hypothetical protein